MSDLTSLKRNLDYLSANLQVRKKDREKAFKRIQEKYDVETLEDAKKLKIKLKKEYAQVRKQRDHYLNKIEKRIRKFEGLLN